MPPSLTVVRARGALASRGTLAFALTLVTPAYAQERAASPEATEAARVLFREGAQLAAQHQWEEARARFRTALALRPSPLLRFNLAVAAQNAGHLVEAIDQYRVFLREDNDPINAQRRREAQVAVSTIEPVLARVTLSLAGVHPSRVRAVRIDGRALPPAVLGVELPVDPGEHGFDALGDDDVLLARAERVLGEGQRDSIDLVPRATAPSAGPADRAHGPATNPTDASAPARLDESAPTLSAAPANARTGAAPAGTIERVRRAIEERAAAPDPFGNRRWDRTLVLYLLLGTGAPTGLVTGGLRWAARPWFELEPQVGIGHPFGPGLAMFVSGRVPWSYQYALGVTLGVGTNFTQITPLEGAGAACDATAASFSPIWLSLGLTNEWRVAPSVAVRASAGARLLANHGPDLPMLLRTRCHALHGVRTAGDLFFDPPTLDRAVAPVLPWFSVDVGWAM